MSRPAGLRGMLWAGKDLRSPDCRFHTVGTGSALGKCKNMTQKINWLHCQGSSSKLILKTKVSARAFALLEE